MRRDNRGFSLVELIIVIAIMAVLIGLLAPQYLRFVRRSKVVTDVNNATNIADAYNATIAENPNMYFTSGTQTYSAGDAPSPAVNGLSEFPESKYDPSFDWVVTIGSEGVSEITLGNKKFYPGDVHSLDYYTELYPQ